MPPAQPSASRLDTAGPDGPGTPAPSDHAAYLAQVMAEIDAEVRRRRASGDLPAGLERELDELFLEFSPVGLHGRARLRETLALVDGAAYVDIAVPTESQKAVGSYVKRAIRKAMGWYIGFIVAQLVKFAWAVSRMFHVVVDHVEELEAAVASEQTPALPADAVPRPDDAPAWWWGDALRALGGQRGRILDAECGNGGLLAAMVGAGLDAYGVEADAGAVEEASDAGLDVRAEGMVEHLTVVGEEALAAVVLRGSVQWLHPSARARLVDLLATRVAVDGVVVLHSATPESWTARASHVVTDLAPGRPLHAETWTHLLAARGFRSSDLVFGGDDRRLTLLDPAHPGAATVNAAIETVNALLLGPGEYLLVAVRER